jgi:quercetin dioxygenase-like cupin family protein
MKRLLAVAGALALVAFTAYARTGLDTLIAETPDQMRYAPDPAHAGYETAVLVGDPKLPGVYAVHTRLPANTTIVPHTHGEKWRIATVLSGTLYYAQGSTFDESKLRALPPGSLIVEPANVAHFARTKGEPVLLHIVGDGPASTVELKK